MHRVEVLPFLVPGPTGETSVYLVEAHDGINLRRFLKGEAFQGPDAGLDGANAALFDHLSLNQSDDPFVRERAVHTWLTARLSATPATVVRAHATALGESDYDEPGRAASPPAQCS